MACSKEIEVDPLIVADIKGIDDIRAMSKLMEDLEIPTKGLKTIEEMKTRTMDFISTQKKKARDWSSGKVFSVLTKAKEEDARKRKDLLDFYNKTGTLLKSKMDEQMLTLLEKHTKEVQENMEQHVKQLEQTEYSLLVAGETSSGKSSLVNLILKEEILPYSLLNTTSTICELKFGKECRMVVHFKDKDPDTGHKTKSISLDKQTAYDKISPFVHKKTDRKESTDIRKIELFWDHEVLEKGIVIIDGPGVGESVEMDEMVANYLPKAFAFIYVINSYNAGGVQKDRVSTKGTSAGFK